MAAASLPTGKAAVRRNATISRTNAEVEVAAASPSPSAATKQDVHSKIILNDETYKSIHLRWMLLFSIMMNKV